MPRRGKHFARSRARRVLTLSGRTAAAVAAVTVTTVCLSMATAGAMRVQRAETGVVSSPAPPRGGGTIEIAVYTRDQRGLAAWSGLRNLTRAASGFDATRTSGVISRAESIAAEHGRERAIRHLNHMALTASSPAQRAVGNVIRRNGGRVLGALPAPSVVLARIPAQAYGDIAGSPLVQAVEPLGERRYMGVAEASGADAWHAAGCTGAGAADLTCPATASPQAGTGPTGSTDGSGGPDLAVDDMGINYHHDAFTGGATPSLGRSPAVVRPQGAPGGNGSLHANTIAAVVAVKDPAHRGIAHGIDKVLDPSAPGYASNLWMLGIPYNGNPGAADLPESINKSYGIDLQTTVALDDYYFTRETDMEVAQYGIAGSNSAGNDGPYPPLGGALRPYSNPGQYGHQARVSHPCVAYNVICVGSVSGNVSASRDDDVVEEFSSRGPSAGGRKKPDLVAEVGSGWGCPDGGAAIVDDSLWKSGSICGEGTSYSAPLAAGAQLLLAGVGITSPMAQKAILVNSAYPIDSEQDPDTSPEEYWAPDVGWGELALDMAYPDRGNYRLGTVGSTPANNARFFRVNGQAGGDRTTLAWHRRAIVTDYSDLDTVGYTTTDLDLQQLSLAGSDNDKDVCGASTTCGVDLSESTETGPTAVASGVVTKWPAGDTATDNVEQVRAASAGDSIIKVRAASTIDGTATEDFALASTEPIVPLATPLVDAPVPTLSDDQTPVGQTVTVTATFGNQSTGADLTDGLDLHSGQATINLPAGVQLVSGSQTQSVGTIATGQTANASWTVQATSSATHEITFTGVGERFGETFKTTSNPAALTADSDPPGVALGAPSGWQGQRTNTVDWDATDAVTGVASVLVEASTDGGAFQTVYGGSTASGNAGITAAEGETVAVRVIATDNQGNQSAYATGSWQVDADPPTLGLTAPVTVLHGDGATVLAAAANVGSAYSLAYRVNGGQLTPLIGTAIALPPVRVKTIVDVQLTDALGRTVSKSVTIDPRPRATSISVKKSRRKRSARLLITTSPAIDGELSVRWRCGKKRGATYPSARRGRATVSLSRVRGRCAVVVGFTPNDQQAYAASTRRIRLRI